MPAVKLVNLAPSTPDGEAEEAHGVLHQRIRNSSVYGWKPIPRDPTVTKPMHHLGPTFTTFAVPEYGCYFDGSRMVEGRLTPEAQARLVRHDWAMHSDVASPAFALPHDPTSTDDVALAKAVSARFTAKAPTEAIAEAKAQAFVAAGRDSSELVHTYLMRAVGLACHFFNPTDVDTDIASHDLIALLAATEQEHWQEVIDRLSGPTMLELAAGIDNLSNQRATTGTQAAAATYVSLTTNTTNPVSTDTTLTGEILTSGAGLAPFQATYAHTNGVASDTQTVTHTANGTDTGLPKDIAQIGLRNAPAGGGTLTRKTKYASAATITAPGDALTSTLTTNYTAT